MFEPLRTWNDYLDQALHALWGAFMTFLFLAHLPTWGAAGLTMAFAIGREMIYQHPGTCGPGCRTDLAFWLLGVLLGGLLWHFAPH